MNPFKHKQLEEFTIADCELYISKYPYGEHVADVKTHMRKLLNEQKIKKQKKGNDEIAGIVSSLIECKKREDTNQPICDKEKRNKKKKNSLTENRNTSKQLINNSSTSNSDKNVWDSAGMILAIILSVIGVIVLIWLFISYPIIVIPLAGLCYLINCVYQYFKD